MERKVPPPPGRFAAMEIIEARGLGVAAAAAILGVRRAALSRVLHGNARLSAELVLRFEKAFDYPMEVLVRMQAGYDLRQARTREAEVVVHGFVPAGEAGAGSD